MFDETLFQGDLLSPSSVFFLLRLCLPPLGRPDFIGKEHPIPIRRDQSSRSHISYFFFSNTTWKFPLKSFFLPPPPPLSVPPMNPTPTKSQPDSLPHLFTELLFFRLLPRPSPLFGPRYEQAVCQTRVVAIHKKPFRFFSRVEVFPSGARGVEYGCPVAPVYFGSLCSTPLWSPPPNTKVSPIRAQPPTPTLFPLHSSCFPPGLLQRNGSPRIPHLRF